MVLSWLREFAPFEGDPAALGDTMSDLGMAVESLERVGEGLDGIVVARVLETRPHPDADKIQLVDVDPGDGGPLQIACGAFNMQAGDLVPLATIGTVMPNGLEIGRRKLRGEWSNGMLCSASEIGLSSDHAGILVLDGDATPGTPLTQALGIESDVVFDLEINPNRPDAMSHIGVARDLAARVGVALRPPSPDVAALESGIAAGDVAAVTIEAPEQCGRFVARVLRNVRVAPSPKWVQQRLTLAGMRPINNVVDASNLVMLELGQPNHAYDLARLPGRALRARLARPGETLTTLDGVERRLGDADLLICDGEDVPVGIAGIMGGASSEISDATTEVLLELAWFDPMTIARTSKRLGLRSEASARFERGVDWQLPELAAARFAEVLAESVPGLELAPGVLEAKGQLPDRPPVRLRTARVNGLLGTDLSDADIRRYLDPIGFEAAPDGDGAHLVTIPSWRYDSAVEVDVIEEVARHHGYSRIAKTARPSAHPGRLDEVQSDRRLVRQVLVGLGVAEAMPLPFLAPGDLERAGLAADAVRLANPLVAEESVLRTSLLPGLLKALSYNAARRNGDVALFEVGHVFAPPPPGQLLPDERERIGVALGGRDAGEAKAVLDVLLDALALDGATLRAGEAPGLHPARTAAVTAPSGTTLGWVGEVDPAVAAAHGVEGRVGWLDLDLGALLSEPHGGRTYRAVSRFPSSDLDLAFVVEESAPAGDVEAALRHATGDLLARLRLFDVYRGDALGPGVRGLTYRLRLQAPDRTLTDEELADVRTRAIEAVESSLPARLRA